MKKLILLILCSLFITGSPLNADMIIGTGITDAVCSTENDSEIVDKTFVDDGNTYNKEAFATKFTIASSVTITEYVWRMCERDQVGSATASVYTDSSNEPGSLVHADTQATLGHASIPDCGVANDVTFTLSSTYELSSGTYWMVLTAVDSADLQVYRDNDQTGERRCFYETGAWSCVDNSTFNVSMWGCN